MLKASILKAKQISKMEAFAGSLLSIASVATDTYVISNIWSHFDLTNFLFLVVSGLVTVSSLNVMVEGLNNLKMYDKKAEKIDDITYSLKQ